MLQNRYEYTDFQYYPEFLKYASFDAEYDLSNDFDETIRMYKEAISAKQVLDFAKFIGKRTVGWTDPSPMYKSMLASRRASTSGSQIANDLYKAYHPKPVQVRNAPYAVPVGDRIVGVKTNPYKGGWRASKPVVSRKGAPVGKGTSSRPVPPIAPVAKKAPTVAPAEARLNDTLDRAALSLSRMRTMAPGGPASTAAEIARQNVVPSSALNFNPMVNFNPIAPQPAAPQPVSLGLMNFNPAMTDVEGLRRYMTAGPKSSYGATHILDAQINELKALPRTPQRDKLLRHLNRLRWDRMRDALRMA